MSRRRRIPGDPSENLPPGGVLLTVHQVAENWQVSERTTTGEKANESVEHAFPSIAPRAAGPTEIQHIIKARGGDLPSTSVRRAIDRLVKQNKLIDQTREVWIPRLGHDLSPEDARQITENVTGFFAVLTDWSRAEISVPANDVAQPYSSDGGEVSDES